jgi:hypothetical protein
VDFAGRLCGDKAPDVLVEATCPPARVALTPLIRGRRLEAVVRLPGWSCALACYIAGASVHVVPSQAEP